jgi:hypothetical protein
MLEPLPSASGSDVTASALYPTTAYADERVHLLDLEWDLHAECTQSSSRGQRIVYRRGRDPRTLATLRADSADVFIVAEGSSYSSPVLAVTETPSGAVAHVLFNDLTGGFASYWQLPADAEDAPLVVPLEIERFPVGQLEIVVGGPGNDVFAFSGVRDLRACNVADFRTCTFVGANHLALRSSPIYFGAPVAELQGPCAPIEGVSYRCFRDEKPYSAAASPRSSNVLYVAYTGSDESGASSVFFTKSEGGTGIGRWSTPTRVHPRESGDTRAFFDPEITFDRENTIIITYSAIAPAPASHDSTVRTYVASGKAESESFEISELGAWDAAGLPTDCLSGYAAFGAYRRPDTVGGRSLHAFRDAASGSLDYVTRWLSEFARP